jgi:Secretion system C-terminal sorting domain
MMRPYFFLLFLVFSFSSSAQTLNTPSLVSPANNATNQSPNVLLDWGTVSSATTYEVRYGTDPTLTVFSVYNVSTSQVNSANLIFGATYYWQVKARSATDSSNWSVIWNFTVLNDVILVSPSNNTINQPPNALLDWNVVSGILGYEVQLDTTNNFNSSLLQTFSVGATSQTLTANLNFGTTWYWRVRAFHQTDTTVWSATWNFTTVDIVTLVAPANNTINQAANELLDWNPVGGVSGYIVQTDTSSSFNSGQLLTISTGNTSQVNTSNLLFGTRYYWRVKAFHNVDTTEWSSSWSFTTIDTVFLVSPVNGAVNQDPNTLLDWNPLSGVSGYQIQYDTSSSFNSPLLTLVNQGSTSQLNTVNLLFGTTYYWRVKGFHSIDSTGWSATWSFNTTDIVLLVSPSNGALNQEPNVMLDWSPVSGINGYQVQYDTSSTFSSPILSTFNTAATSQLNVGNLLFGSTYYWRVKAFHTADTSNWSTVWSFTTLNSVNLVAPSNGAINQVPNVTTDWAPVTGIAGYQLQLDTNNSFASNAFIEIILGATSQSTTADLFFGTNYQWRVRAFHLTDTSDWSATWSFRTTDSLILLSPANNATALPLILTLDWAALSGVNGFEAQLSTDSLFVNPASYIATSSQQALVNLSYGTRYFWRARAYHANDTTSWGTTWNFETINQINSIPVLVYPANNSINILPSDSLKWYNAIDPLVTSYEVQLDTNNTFISPLIFNSIDSLQDFSGLNWNTTYYWRVRCKNSSGNGPWSVAWNFTTVLNVGLEEQEATNVTVYPNPGNSQQSINIILEDAFVHTMEIYSLNGQLIQRQNYPSGARQLETIISQKGVYLIKLIDQVGKVIRATKILIE